MKLTEQERRGVELGIKHAATIDALTRVLEDSTLTRSQLCRAVVGVAFSQAGCDEAVTRERLYRMLIVMEAAIEGKLLR